jgi:hypothetical protein
MAKASLKKLRTATHKGRPTRTGGRPYAPGAAGGFRASNIRGDARLTAAKLTGIPSTPRGPEPGHGGKMY